MCFDVTVLASGYCQSYKKLAIKTDLWRRHAFPAAFGLIKHASGKSILVDTGYAKRVSKQMNSFPFKLYGAMLPITQSRRTAVDLMAAQDVDPEDVDLIILTHFHPDHIGGLKDFPKACILCSRIAWESVKNRRGFSALMKGFLPDLIPEDFETRARYFEDLPQESHPFSEEFNTRKLSFYGDTLSLVELPGHVPGHIGLLVEGLDKKHFFVADAVWDKKAITENALPHPLAMMVHDNRKAYKQTIKKLQNLYKNSPDIAFIPTHHPGSK